MRNISIKIKVLVPIAILSLVIIMACGFSMVNQKNLLNTGYVMSDELSKQSDSVQQYADSIALSVRESSEGIHNAASNTEGLPTEITNISDKFNINKEVANSLGREAERFII